MTTSLILCCVVLGQTLPTPPAIPVPTSSARRDAEAPAGDEKLFGTPTPADPAQAPLGNDSDDAIPLQLPDQFELSEPPGEPLPSEAPATEPSFIQPAAASAPLGGAALLTPQRSAEGQARKLIDAAFPTDLDPSVPRLPLRDLLKPGSDRPRQLTAIRTYWEAAVLLADWRYANWELETINQLQAPRDAVAQANLAATQAAARARVVDAEMAAMNARLALAEAVPSASLSDPPLPGDPPFAGRYNTQYEKLFAARPAPVGLKRIHQILPLRYSLVEARAASVMASEEALDGQLSSYRSGRATLADVQHALDRLRQQRGSFLGAVRDYNFDIAEYALAAAANDAPPETMVAMLIEVQSPAATLASQPSSVRSVLVTPAGGSTPAAGFANPSAPSATPASGFAPVPRLIQASAPVGGALPATGSFAPSSNGGAATRPLTERVLGTLREVTNPTAPTPLLPRSPIGPFTPTPGPTPTLPPR